jgi:hypothetical protein
MHSKLGYDDDVLGTMKYDIIKLCIPTILLYILLYYSF